MIRQAHRLPGPEMVRLGDPSVCFASAGIRCCEAAFFGQIHFVAVLTEEQVGFC